MIAPTGSAAFFVAGEHWSLPSRPGFRRGPTVVFRGCGVRKWPCLPASAPTTTCAWSAAATRTPRRGSSNRSPGSCGSIRSSRTSCSTSPPRVPGRGGARNPNACPRGCTSCSRACRFPHSWKDARSTCSPPTGSRSRSRRAWLPGTTRCDRCSWTPRSRAFQQDWTRSAEGFIAAFRKSIGDDIDNPRFVELVGELALTSERFQALWARHDIRGLDGGTTTVNHPVVGQLHLHRDSRCGVAWSVPRGGLAAVGS
jgi:hypothetical protein